MANTPLTVQIAMRNDTAENWQTKNPQLLKGEMGVEIDTNKFKFGDGVTNWNDLNYVQTGSGTVDFSSLSVAITGDVEAASQRFGADGTLTLTAALKKVVEAGTYAKVTVNEKGLVTGFSALAADDIPELTSAKITDLGSAAVKNVGASAGNVVVVAADGKIDTSLLPAIAISEPFACADEAAMLALDAQTGDIAIRADESKCYILKEAPASDSGNWLDLKVPASAVLSVNGRTGAVTLDTDGVSEGSTNLYYTEDRATANFTENIAKTSVASLSDGEDVLFKTDTLILNGGGA